MHYVIYFSLVKILSFIFCYISCFIIIFGSLPFSSLVLPKIVTFVMFESLFSFSSQLAQVLI